jgi:hypothetical protein
MHVLRILYKRNNAHAIYDKSKVFCLYIYICSLLCVHEATKKNKAFTEYSLGSSSREQLDLMTDGRTDGSLLSSREPFCLISWTTYGHAYDC